MPVSAPRPCSHPGCTTLSRDGTGRCTKHPKPAWQKKPTAAKRITGRKLQRLRAELFTRDPLCAECKRFGRATRATQRDHIVSLEEGGQDVEENTQGLCYDCHEAKSKAERERGVQRVWRGYRES
ncbi:MAG: HNH endonuclease [Comamonadaceae bacterium]|nr:MAG: HNH endonuclease [Comamonadaceae bacterium]